MKKLKLFFACLLMAVLSIGQVWGVSVALTQAEIKAATAQSSYPSTEVNVSSESGTWHGKMIINTSTGFVQIRKNTANNYCGSPTFAGGVTQVVITTCNNTASGRTFYLRANTQTAQPSSGDYGSGSISEANGTATITVTDAPTSFYIYSNGAAYISSITVTYSSGDPDPVLQSIAVSGTPTTKSYEAGAAFDPAGLVVTGTYDVGDPATITSSITWTACKTEDGTYVALDDEAVALAKDETGIYVKATVSEITSPAFHVTGLTVTAAQPKITIDGSADGITTTDEAQTITAGVGSFGGMFKQYSTTALWFTKGSGYIYNTASFGYIRKITINYKSGGAGDAYQWIKMGNSVMNSYEAASTNGVKYETSTGGSSNTFVVDGDFEYFCLSVSNKNLQASSIVIEYDNTPSAPKAATPTFPTGDENFLTSTSVTLSCETTGATIYYTTDGSAPTTSSSVYSAAIPVSATTTIKAMAVADGMDNSNVAEKTFTKATVMTVAEARTTIDAGGDLTNKYVAGIISQIDSYNSTYHSITYWISDDGTTTDQLQVYSGLAGIVKAEFESVADLSVGDDVTVKGTLKKYSSTYEFDKNNVIVARKPIARLAWSGTTEGAYAASLEGGNTFPTLTNSDGVSVSYSSSETSYASFSDASDYSTLTLNAVGSTVITATFAGNSSFKANSASYTLNVSSSVIKADISFECNGAASCPEDELAASNLPSPLPAITKAGYNFGGWFMDSEFNTPAVAGDAVASTDPITLYAKWLDPYTVTEALAIIDALVDGAQTESSVYVAGIVSTAPTANPSSGKLTFYISVDGAAAAELQAYNCKNLNNENFTAKTDIEVGDEVTIFGPLKKFMKNSVAVPEFNTGYLYAFNRPVEAVTGVTLESTASVPVGGTVTLHASVVPVNAANKTINWSVQSGSDKASVADGVVTGIAEGTAVIRAASDEDASIYAECTVTVAPLSPWATTYTSNIELSVEGGTSASVAKVKFDGEETEYAAIKAGVSGTAGVVVVSVPAGATALHFHAYSWSTETVELTVTAPAGVTVAPSAAIAINKNSGISGNSPFTLEAGSTPQFDAYYAVSLSGNTEPIDLTISATSGKRFVLFGVNQEGGLVLESISVGGTASVLEYTDGQHFDPTGLSVTGHYSDDSTAPITEGISWAFDPDPLTEGTTSVSVTATAAGFTSEAFVVNGLTVAGAAPLSPWATTWTSNLDDIAGSKVKFYGEETEYAALKAGSSGTAGTATLNIPAQATELHLHAYGWNSEDVTLSITAPAGVTVTPASITLNRNSGFASNSPFTLAQGSTPQTDAYYALSLSGNDEAIELTITATAGKRFLLFGVNQVGGVLPELQSIAISGNVTKKSGYKVGDEIDHDGLTVMATSTLGDVPQTPEDVTAKVEWSHDPLVEGQTEVTLTATYKEKTASTTITLTEAVASADPAIYVNPSLYVNFASVEKDAALPETKTITVTLTNVAAGTAALGGTNPEAFSIDKTALVEGENVITISVASTATAGEFSATITLTDNASVAPQKVVNLSFTVNEPVTPEDPEVRKTWDLSVDETATASTTELTWTATYVSMSFAKGTSTTNTNNYYPGTSGQSYTSTRAYKNSVITITPNGKEITSVVFTATTTGYANALAGSTWTNATASADNMTVTVTPIDGKSAISATVGGTCGFTAVQVNYKNIAPEPPTPSTPDYTRTVEINRYGTICLPNGGNISGAKLFDLEYYDGANTLYLLEVNGNAMVAGRPYIFLPSATTIQVFYTDNANASAGSYHGLVGSYTQEAVAIGEGDEANYILYENAYYLVNSTAYVGANRAYIHMADVPTEPSTPQVGQVPRRRVTMAVHGEQTATGFENINASEKPMKLMIDGNIYILRGEKMYDATGRLVK